VGSVGGSPFTILSKIQNPTPNILQQQYELARIDEVKETPSVIILDGGRPAVERSKPQRKLIVITSMLLGGIVAMGFTFIKRNFVKYIN